MTLARRQPEGLQAIRIEPNPHGISAGAEHLDGANPGQPGQLVLNVDLGVVGEKQIVVAPVR